VVFGLNGVIIEPDVTSGKEGDQVGVVALGAINSLLHNNQ
jgi:hypothetical protein